MREECPLRNDLMGYVAGVLEEDGMARVQLGIYYYTGHLILLKQCSRCRGRVYCGKECQRQDWKVHRRDCSLDKAKELTRRVGGEGWGDKSTLFGVNMWMSGNNSIMVASSERRI